MTRAPKLPPPVYDPADVAKAILYAAEHGPRDVDIGGGGKLMSAPRKRVPAVTDRMGAAGVSKTQKAGLAGRDRNGALYEAGRDGAVRGGSPHLVRRSVYTQASINPVLTGILLAGATAAAASLLGPPGRSSGRRAATPSRRQGSQSFSAGSRVSGRANPLPSGDPMARDQSGGATPSPEERAAGARAGRKHLGEDGRPQTPPTADAQEAADRTATTGTGKPEPIPRATKDGLDGA